jgi:probable HAF family extracellular repeat protein
VSFEVPGSAPQTTAPHGINDSGEIAGFFDGLDNETHAFFLHNGTFTTVDYPGASITAFFGINERGDAVGNCTCVDGKFHGLLLSRGTFTFNVYPGAAHTRPKGINDRGQIVGFYDAAGVTHGFIATPAIR